MSEQQKREGETEKSVAALPNQPQEPKLAPWGSELPNDYYEARVTITVAIPHRGPHPGFHAALEDVLAALQSQKPLPDGSFVRGGIVISTRTAKEIRADYKRAARKRANEYP